MVRWVFDFHLFSIRIHHWLHSDDMRHPHDHPWWFIVFCIWGTYIDVSPEREDYVRQGSFRFRSATHQHSVKIVKPAWTILLCGPESRRWGFWVRGKFRKRNKYFYEHGHHHPCDPTKEKVK